MDVDRIYRDHYGYIRRACYSFVKNWADAEDVTQDTFIIAMKKQPKVYCFKAIRSWLYRTARFECLKFLSKRRFVCIDDIEVEVEHEIERRYQLQGMATERTAGFITNICQKLTTQFA